MLSTRCAPFAVLALAAPCAAQCELDQLVAADPLDDARFGAALALSGDLAVVGAPSIFVPSDPGAAYVFARAEFDWAQVAKLTAFDGAPTDRFGAAVATDGTTVVVGAPQDDDAGTSSGSAYVYTAAGAFEAKLGAPDAAASARFGAAVVVAGDTLVVGAPRAAACYVFTKSGSSWSFQTKLTASDAATNQRDFGETLALEGDRLVVGTQLNISAAEGAAFVFERSGSAWSEVAILTATLPFPGPSTSDEFGSPVALDADTIVVGAPGYDGGGSYDEGAAFVFVRSGSTWTQQAMLVSSWGATVTNVARSVALAGERVVLGSRVGSPGSVHLFERSGTSWSEGATLLPAGFAAFDDVGAALALDGDVALVSAPEAQIGADQAGSVSAWSLSGAACPSLLGAPAAVSVGAGGAQQLRLDAGAANAGALYLLLGTASGSSPGFVVDGFVVPLNVPDPYFELTLLGANAPPLASSFALLDAAGTASASFALPPASNPALAGLTLHHAYALLDLVSIPGAAQVSFTSNAAALQLVP